MYAVKLDSVAGSSSSFVEDEAPRPESSGAGNSDLPTSTGELQTDTIGFTAGNPRVEHLTGVVHLYRCLPKADEGEPRAEADSAEEETPPPSLPVCATSFPERALLCAGSQFSALLNMKASCHGPAHGVAAAVGAVASLDATKYGCHCLVALCECRRNEACAFASWHYLLTLESPNSANSWAATQNISATCASCDRRVHTQPV